MRKISAILPVYDEEVLIKPCLEHLDPYVDEIILIDGGPDGPSDDKTAEIAKNFDKVKYVSGTYKTIPGAWDAGSQKNHGISEATGDVLLFLSADMFFQNIEFLCRAMRSDDGVRVYFANTIEFWIDSAHIRMYSAPESLSIMSLPQEAVAVAREAQPVANQHGSLEVSFTKPEQQAFIANTTKYHLGWIRPFDAQVAKHIRHVRQGRWGDQGDLWLKGSEQKLEQWALLHVLSYKKNPSIRLNCELPPEWDFMKSMSCTNKQTDTIKSYEARFKTSLFKGAKE